MMCLLASILQPPQTVRSKTRIRLLAARGHSQVVRLQIHLEPGIVRRFNSCAHARLLAKVALPACVQRDEGQIVSGFPL
ncbi:MAG: hypothetical protein CVU19_07020 [Betaproteobacteria bacterium HGW-Betaproteobacteria-13]|jgi:hypothetical protein|uniref:Uncharacterized protein n=1 Tax=Parazoarcus communis TaxID=41977 RepID=A0A2U8H5U8_9RHOO|nr:hypothetical protein CEW87_17740 [Parazoarcus communis]PKO81427.1 MAG: hypothetical protein CVU19_07020 [Betaproteobacteria bacterium HGW-Betaproteobacteria-13]